MWKAFFLNAVCLFLLSCTAADTKGNRVWISVQDGSKSCEPQSGTPLSSDQARLEKAGIQVFQSEKSHDGGMHIQVCGANTGKTNSFLIAETQLSKAEALGFALQNKSKN